MSNYDPIKYSLPMDEAALKKLLDSLVEGVKGKVDGDQVFAALVEREINACKVDAMADEMDRLADGCQAAQEKIAFRCAGKMLRIAALKIRQGTP